MSTLNPYKPDVVTPKQKTSLEISLEQQRKAAKKKAEESETKSE